MIVLVFYFVFTIDDVSNFKKGKEKKENLQSADLLTCCVSEWVCEREKSVRRLIILLLLSAFGERIIYFLSLRLIPPPNLKNRRPH